MHQLRNDIIASPHDGGLIGSRHANANDMIISDTMLWSLGPTKLRPMKNHQKIMCGYAICNTSNYFK